MLLKISDIRTDSKYVVREIDDATVNDYADAISDGKELPRPTVFFDGRYYWPGDGRHRMAAHLKAGRADIEVEVKNGTERDAYLFGVGANQKHGLRLKAAEKRRIVETFLNDNEWSAWSNHEIAKRSGVVVQTVGNMRISLSNLDSEIEQAGHDEQGEDSQNTRTYVNKHGQKATMNVGKIGKRKKRKRAAVVEGKPLDNGSTVFDWRAFELTFGALYREVDNLGRIYNRHNTDDANALRFQLDLWSDKFKTWGDKLEAEKKEEVCVSA